MRKAAVLFLSVCTTFLTLKYAFAAPKQLNSGEIASCIRRLDCKRTFVVAHRSNGFKAPENSREAVSKALLAGVDIIEIDVRESKDGYWYISHDSSLARTTTRTDNLNDKISLELEDVLLKNGETLPMLEDIYDLTYGRKILNLDFKVNAVEKVAEWIASKGSFDDFIFFVDNGREMRSAAKMKVKYPEMIVMARLSGDVSLKKIKNIFGELPEIIHTDFTTAEDIQALKSEGVKVFANAFSAERLPSILKFLAEQQLLAAEIDFIQTDDPKHWKKKLRKVEKKYEKWFNFGVVYPDKLIRSSAPTKRFLRYAKERYGINIVVDLRSPTSPNEGPQILKEREWAAELGVKYISLHATSSDMLKHTEYLRRLMDENENHRILVHCQGGKDRTGALVAYLRMQDGWSYEEARKEMEKYGHDAKLRPNFHERLKKFYENIKSPK